MHLRRLVVLGFCSSFALATSAVAAMPPIPNSAAGVRANGVVEVAAPKAEPKSQKRKVASAKGKGKGKSAKAKPLSKEELAAKTKAEEKAKKEAAAKTKAAEKAKLLAKAKAEKEKKLEAAKAEKEKKLAAAKVERAKAAAARAKADEERRLARAKADEERKLARGKAEEERRLARAAAAEQRRLAAEAKVKAAEEKRLARIRAEEERRLALARAEEQRRQAEIAELVSMEVAKTGNNGELRSEAQEAPQQTGLFAGLFGGGVKRVSMLPETRALDAVLEQKKGSRAFKVRPEFEPQTVEFSGYPRGTIVIDTSERFLYLVEGSSRARRYAIAVGREGLQFKGAVSVGDKQEWPRWIPTLEMQKRDPAKYVQYKDGMPGGPENPLGARAIYLYQTGKDTHLRIHGTNQPETIGTSASNGCFRMINEHVMDLYRRVKVGTEVIVL